MNGSETRNRHWGNYAERLNEAFGLLFLLVVLAYAVGSLNRYEGWGAVLITATVGLASAVAFGSSGMGPARVRTVALGGLLATGLAAIAAIDGGDPLLAAAAAIQVALMISATVVVLRDVLGASNVGFRTILGAISVYMIFGLLFTSLYTVIDRLQNGVFFEAGGEGTGDFLFFSITTLTTTGYGDLVPAGQPGRMFAGLEMLIGQIFLVTLIAGLVSLWRPRRRS